MSGVNEALLHLFERLMVISIPIHCQNYIYGFKSNV